MNAGTRVASGQTTLSGGADQLIDPTDLNDTAVTVIVKAHAANANPLYLGPEGVTTANGLEVAAGDYLAIDVINPGELYVIGTATQKAGWLVLRP